MLWKLRIRTLLFFNLNVRGEGVGFVFFNPSKNFWKCSKVVKNSSDLINAPQLNSTISEKLKSAFSFENIFSFSSYRIFSVRFDWSFLRFIFRNNNFWLLIWALNMLQKIFVFWTFSEMIWKTQIRVLFPFSNFYRETELKMCLSRPACQKTSESNFFRLFLALKGHLHWLNRYFFTA